MTLENLLNNVQILAIVCNQWGDSGKGKFVDYFSEWTDVIIRCTGGNNAGHTVSVDDIDYIFHLIPSGILHDKEGKVCVIGDGVVVPPEQLCAELDACDKAGISYDHLMISEDAFLVLPFHVDVDKRKNASQKDGGIGTTGRGIGPAYGDKNQRAGVQVRDLYHVDVLRRKIRERLLHYEFLRRGELAQSLFMREGEGDEYENRLRSYGEMMNKLGVVVNEDDIKRLRQRSTGELVDFYQDFITRRIPVETMADDLIASLAPYAERIRPFVTNTFNKIHECRAQGKKILLEGAQGLLLSVEFGTYPYVTSSDPSVNGTATGAGLPASAVDLVLATVKFPFCTRVGAGPFVTELGGRTSERYCGEPNHTKLDELQEYGIPLTFDAQGKVCYDHHHQKILQMMNNIPFIQGIGIRLAAEEYGATTGRPRRVGWTDLAALRYAHLINRGIATKLILTKVDSLAGIDHFFLSEGYQDGPHPIDYFCRDESFLRRVQPNLKRYPGYGDISTIREFHDLPQGLLESAKDVESCLKDPGCVAMISVGPKRNQTIVRETV